ncbi:hypothetical protein B0A58_09730 [Flavobacterium branchiophilum NBRC 15030 = ATCC 35035]|uniref:Uncharacterized protein n=1 Tax=Flavobacterium branchiophilum TaxID=55197 RepID=A0A2H3KA72_9FLAO|nr:hypothetical protein [Flavobacterium branchiophilum]OXA74922.1 hypothetical protein B0A58_09730 [Flavobacterium branchiophilum NBRC 15030 = ATCC 35035]PDS23393.1 hypothetical protein B0A77_10845 [Flavobacterium branchiophilum]TQM40363.1 hypothetical protein BC670_1246 [Flavobacterium branchiophilum]GEM54445.1 hypothetical protein FB1_06660 [Flavobacterium branchiophilum NBRC 15030 = ATCC 35035]
MNERWKYQVKTGGIWGIFMIVFSTWYYTNTKPLALQLAEGGYYFRAVGYLVFGVFVLGYSSWTAKQRREGK